MSSEDVARVYAGDLEGELIGLWLKWCTWKQGGKASFEMDAKDIQVEVETRQVAPRPEDFQTPYDYSKPLCRCNVSPTLKLLTQSLNLSLGGSNTRCQTASLIAFTIPDLTLLDVILFDYTASGSTIPYDLAGPRSLRSCDMHTFATSLHRKD